MTPSPQFQDATELSNFPHSNTNLRLVTSTHELTPYSITNYASTSTQNLTTQCSNSTFENLTRYSCSSDNICLSHRKEEDKPESLKNSISIINCSADRNMSINNIK